jgi:hypothetical protein
MATLKHLPSDIMVAYAARAFGFTTARAGDVLKAAKLQLGVRSLASYPHSISHLLTTAASDAKRSGINPSVLFLVNARNAAT